MRECLFFKAFISLIKPVSDMNSTKQYFSGITKSKLGSFSNTPVALGMGCLLVLLMNG